MDYYFRVLKIKSNIIEFLAFSSLPCHITLKTVKLRYILNGKMFETVSKHMLPVLNNVYDTTNLKKFSPIELGNSEIIKTGLVMQ